LVFNREGENVSNYSILRNDLQKYEQRDTNYAIVKGVPPNSSLGLTEYDDEMISTWNFGSNLEINDMINKQLQPTWSPAITNINA